MFFPSKKGQLFNIPSHAAVPPFKGLFMLDYIYIVNRLDCSMNNFKGSRSLYNLTEVTNLPPKWPKQGSMHLPHRQRRKTLRRKGKTLTVLPLQGTLQTYEENLSKTTLGCSLLYTYSFYELDSVRDRVTRF